MPPLDIDPETPVYDKANRPLLISHGGEVIREILLWGRPFHWRTAEIKPVLNDSRKMP